MKHVNWLLVGAGKIAQRRVALALSQAEGSRLIAVCSRQKEQAKSLANQFGAREVFVDFTEALSATSAEAVYLATPVWLHAPQAVQALTAGRHVLVEKPLGLSAAECSTVVAAAERSGKFASCAYYRRFYPRYRYTKTMLDAVNLGPIVSVNMTYSSWFDPAPDDPGFWRVVKAKSGGGPICDMGSHMFDVMIGLFGLPRSVSAQCASLVRRWDVEDCAAINMRLQNGASAQSRLNWNSKTWQHEFSILGTEARIDWSPYDSGPVIKTVGRNVEQLQLPSVENVHLPLVEDFVDSILANRSPLFPLMEALKTNTLIDAIYQSAHSGVEVKIN